MPLVLAFESALCFLVISCCGFVFPFSLFSLNPALFCKEQFPQGGESSGQPDFHVFCGRLGREHNAPWKPRVQDVHVENCQFFFFNTRCILIWNKFIFSSLTSYYMHWVFFIKDKHSFLWLLCLCIFFLIYRNAYKLHHDELSEICRLKKKHCTCNFSEKVNYQGRYSGLERCISE